MNILITGDRGFLGRHLVKKIKQILKPKKNDCINTDNYDLTQNNIVSKLSFQFCENNYKYIFHLAAWTKAGDFCLSHQGEQWEKNQLINTHILQYWKKYQPQAKMITIGTSCGYDPNILKVEKNYLKGEPDKDLYTYGMTKRMLLVGLQSYAKQYNMKYLYFIPNTLYGPNFDTTDSHFIFDIIKKIYAAKYNKKEPVTLWGNGLQRRELIYIDDAVNSIVSLINIENQIINIATGYEYTIIQYAQNICKILNYPFEKIKFDTSKFTGVRSKCLIPNDLALCSTPLINGLEKTILYYHGINHT